MRLPAPDSTRAVNEQLDMGGGLLHRPCARVEHEPAMKSRALRGGRVSDQGQAAANMQLVATALGIGSCVITLHNQELAREVLGVPAELSCRWTITFGYSAAQIRATGVRDMATLHLMVGLPCSGKTTLARTLEHERSALRLTPDEWQLRLFGQDAEEPEHDARHSLIEAMLWEVASRALVLETNVILDFGFWAREEREDFRSRARQLGASSEVHFLDVPEDELLRRLAQRNAEQPPTAFYIPEVMMKPWIALFQKPAPDELERRE